MTQPNWRIRLGAKAEKDFARILKYTRENFGPRQAEIYKTTILEALAALSAGPETCLEVLSVTKSSPGFGLCMLLAKGAGDATSLSIELHPAT